MQEGMLRHAKQGLHHTENITCVPILSLNTRAFLGVLD